MSEKTTSQRAIRGAMEGAATGLAVASVRAGVALYREPNDLGTHLPEIVRFFAVIIICCGYIFAIGRTIADGIAGSLLGATIIAFSGILITGSLVSYDPTGIPYPIIVAGACGALVGAPFGASIHRYIAKPRKSE